MGAWGDAWGACGTVNNNVSALKELKFNLVERTVLFDVKPINYRFNMVEAVTFKVKPAVQDFTIGPDKSLFD